MKLFVYGELVRFSHMKNVWKKNEASKKGQGALEYLLLIGGAVLIATIVLLVIIGSTGSTNDIINNNLGVYQTHVSLGATGGGSGGNCGNGTIQAGEQCDGANLNAQTCTTIPGGFTGGTLSCNANCTFNTSACTSPPGNPSFASFTASTGAGSGQLSVSWSITNFNLAGPNEIKGWVTDPGITTPAQFDSTGGTAFSTTAIGASTGTAPFTGLTPNTGYFIYMKACNTTSCVVSPLATATASYSSIAFEGEVFDGQPGESCLRTVSNVSYSGGLALAYESGSCASPTDGVSSFVVNVDPAITTPTPFKVMVRAFKATTGSQPVIIDGTSLSIIASNPPLWRPGVFGTNVVTLTGGANTIDITFPAASGVPVYAIDMVLLTSDTACVPGNASPNFEDPCA